MRCRKRKGEAGIYRERQVDVGRQGKAGRDREMHENVGRDSEMQGELGRGREIKREAVRGREM